MNKLSIALFAFCLALAISKSDALSTNISSFNSGFNTSETVVVPYFDMEQYLREEVVMYNWTRVFTNAFDSYLKLEIMNRQEMTKRLSFLFGDNFFESFELNVTFSGTLNNHTMNHTFHSEVPLCNVSHQENGTFSLNASMTVEHHNSSTLECDFTRTEMVCTDDSTVYCVLEMDYSIHTPDSDLYNESGHLSIPLPKCPPSETLDHLELDLEIDFSVTP